MTYRAADPKLFFSKNDPQDIRLGDLVRPAAEIPKINQAGDFCISGYPDDEGIRLNSGRPGAAAAPTSIRQILYKMTPPSLQGLNCFDIGDLIGSDLTGRHHLAEESVFQLQQKQLRTLSLGGGHDYGFSDAGGFVRAHLARGLKPVVLNFDAHLDVRPTDKGFNSGTPFYRLLSQYQGRFDFAEIGIQPHCNSVHHRQWAEQHGAHIFDLAAVQKAGGLTGLLTCDFFARLTPQTPVFISFDIDGLMSSEAPGCSQSWPTGLSLQDYLNFFAILSTQTDVRGLGIYEVSPPLDFDNYTSKSAALIAYHFLFQGRP